MLRSVTVLLLVSLAACSGARNWEVANRSSGDRFSRAEVRFEDSAVRVNRDALRTLQAEIEERLYEDEGFQAGNDLRLYVQFQGYDEGSRFARWALTGIGGAGEGTVTVRTRFVNPVGQVIAETRTEGSISAGFFGGSIDSALEQAAERIADYARDNFLR